MQFSKIVGQQAAKKGLINMWRTGHFPHAILLAGNEGTGGLPMALALAQYIFCENKKEDDSCGHCANCSKTARLEHADLHLSFPAFGPKVLSTKYIYEFREFVRQTPYASTYDWLQYIDAENKQGNITAEECRDIIEKLNLKSYEGNCKVQIIWRPEYLGKEGNILLKLIEEPPANTYLILVAEELDDILATIQSRTQEVKLAPIKEKDIAEALVHRSHTDPRKAAQVAHMANGSFNEALRLLRHTTNDLFPEVRNWFNAIFKNNGIAISKFAEEWSKSGREQQKNLLHYTIQLLEQAIRVRYLPEHPPALPEEEAQFVQKLAVMPIQLETLNGMVKELSDTIYFIERNAHSKTQLHALSIRMVYVVQGKSVGVL